MQTPSSSSSPANSPQRGNTTLCLNPRYGWTSKGGLHCREHGSVGSALLLAMEKDDREVALTNTLKKSQDYSGGIIETQTHILAWADHIRTFPIFFAETGGKLAIGNDARMVLKESKLDEPDQNAAVQFAMAGYVTGDQTLYKGLKCLQPGEFLLWNKEAGALSKHRYHKYIPKFNPSDKDENKKRLGEILDNLTKKIIARANGQTIWVPLSAGLDSRILLCKLHEHGYTNIQTFTYGPRFNFEGLHARRIAKTLNVPWRMISLTTKEYRECFESEDRKAFWRFADGLKTIPCMREFSAIRYLHQSGEVKQGDIFLNGQSGDYITGGHIPEQWLTDGTTDAETFYNQIFDKHYDLWTELKTQDNKAIIKTAINALIPEDKRGQDDNRSRAIQSEIWEYDGRQVCYVAHGQRVYEFFGYDWEMPLWEKELVDFCETLPLEQKANQALYKEYLRDYNYKGLFPKEEPYIWRWPIPMLWVVPVAQLVGLIKGRKSKDNFYAKMRYYGHYANQYAFFEPALHNSTYTKTRTVISLYVREWIKQNPELFTEDLRP